MVLIKVSSFFSFDSKVYFTIITITSSRTTIIIVLRGWFAWFLRSLSR